MTKARSLPEADQDVPGAVLPTIAGGPLGPDLDDEARAAIAEGLGQARRGEVVSSADVAAIWRRFGL